jgi:hypothetical protein
MTFPMDIPSTSSAQLTAILDEQFIQWNNTMICAGKSNNDASCVHSVCHISDQLIGDSLEGLSGRIVWGVLQLLLMILGNIGRLSFGSCSIEYFDDISCSIFIGNLLTLIVLNRHLMRKCGMNNLLQGLAISDMVAPTIACIPHIIYYYGPNNGGSLINIVNSFIMPIATGATFCSNWIGRRTMFIFE